ncbi:type II secretion system F family protein [Actinomadura sp. ATCC 31491]|uniref:Type II secretion system F family protein n=1 Tax=Actinomadura luzonensis TaxID=2805427 RepID=A0ABT0FQE4_9ACTN|nr:type II secretion system F family protein [Actinomadura luzonensis]MCK2214571.1 type II secretion system F family protein [Actinomadura luzonensis]
MPPAAWLAALSTACALWLWTTPTAATTRLAKLTTRSRTPKVTTQRRKLLDLLLTPQSPKRRAEAWRLASIELCQALTAELSTGRTPGEALTRAIPAVSFPDADVLRPVLAAARDGGDVPAALRTAAPQQGGEGLCHLAACWQVSLTAGAALAALTERVAATLRTAQMHRQDVAAQLAGPRTTARMLAVLPVLGLLMAAALNMHPLNFLFGSLPGLACLTTGTALNACGLWWTNRLSTTADP